MTGPEHYQAGEAALEEAKNHGPDEPMHAGLTQLAVAHFTAANAAATALMRRDEPPDRDWQAWYRAAGTKQPPKPKPHDPVSTGPDTQCRRCGRPIDREGDVWFDDGGDTDCTPKEGASQ